MFGAERVHRTLGGVLVLWASAFLLFVAPASAQQKPSKKPAGSSASRLLDAYKREFAFLEAEKRSLQARLSEEKKEAQGRLGAAKAETDRLQGQIVNLASEAQRLEELLLSAEREYDSLDQSEDVVGDILTRASSAFSKVDVAMPEADSEDREALRAQMQFAFTKAPEVLAMLGQVRRKNGEYFDATGEKVSGPILMIGDVATYGLADGARGVLAPAGESRLKLWPAEGGTETAEALAAGKQPEMLPIFLYESLDQGIEQKKDKSALDVVRAGGTIAWVIVGLGVLALLMVIARFFLLLRASMGNRNVLEPVLGYVERGKYKQALDVAARAHNSSGRVLTATLRNLDKSREQLEDIVAEAVLDEQPRLSRFGSAILVLAAVSPLMGLLGTVTGMISTFDVITEFGTGNPKLLSGGISEALITTELGLIVAIPALLVGHMLSGWSERIRDTLDASALAVVNRAAGFKPPSTGESLEIEPSSHDDRAVAEPRK